MSEAGPEQGHHGKPRLDPGTGRKLAVVIYGSTPTDDEPQEPETSHDEPKPKRRPAWRHALGGLALLVCLGMNLWLLERGGTSIIGDWWVKAKAGVCGPRMVRDQVRIGMKADDVYRHVGYGSMRKWYDSRAPHPTFALATQSEDYPEYGFRVIWCGSETRGENNRTVLAIEDLP